MARKPPADSMLGDIEGMPTEAQAKREERDLRSKLAMAERIIEAQQERIDNLTAKRFEIPSQGRVKKSRGNFVRVIVPDSHGCFIDWDAANAMLRDIKALNPKEVVMIGDHVDCSGMLAQHHTWGVVAEADYTYQDDLNAANLFLDRLQAAAPGAVIYYIEGNHELRISKWALTTALRIKTDAQFLLDKVGVEANLYLSKRGIRYIDQGTKHMGLGVPGTIKLGPCYFTHGTSHGKQAALAMLRQFGTNVVFGHVHKLLQVSDHLVHAGSVCAWAVGSVCNRQPLWGHARPSDWNLGYGVQLVKKSLEFLHINVPVINGQSYLLNLTERIPR